jgi:hypothetical protein
MMNLKFQPLQLIAQTQFIDKRPKCWILRD